MAYVSLFSYFSSRGRFGVVSHTSHSIKDVYLVPLSSTESIPPLLQPFEGPGTWVYQLCVLQLLKQVRLYTEETLW